MESFESGLEVVSYRYSPYIYYSGNDSGNDRYRRREGDNNAPGSSLGTSGVVGSADFIRTSPNQQHHPLVTFNSLEVKNDLILFVLL